MADSEARVQRNGADKVESKREAIAGPGNAGQRRNLECLGVYCNIFEDRPNTYPNVWDLRRREPGDPVSLVFDSAAVGQ